MVVLLCNTPCIVNIEKPIIQFCGCGKIQKHNDKKIKLVENKKIVKIVTTV